HHRHLHPSPTRRSSDLEASPRLRGDGRLPSGPPWHNTRPPNALRVCCGAPCRAGEARSTGALDRRPQTGTTSFIGKARRSALDRSEEHTSELQSLTNLV